MTDRAGRRKRRGAYRPFEGKHFIIRQITNPLDAWCSHYVEMDGKAVRTPLGGLVMGSEQALRDLMYRQGADEAVTP